MTDYTPTTEEVRDGYWFNDGGMSDPEDAKRFDRWLVSVQADAWDEGAEYMLSCYQDDRNSYVPDHPRELNPYRSEKQ